MWELLAEVLTFRIAAGTLLKWKRKIFAVTKRLKSSFYLLGEHHIQVFRWLGTDLWIIEKQDENTY